MEKFNHTEFADNTSKILIYENHPAPGSGAASRLPWVFIHGMFWNGWAWRFWLTLCEIVGIKAFAIDLRHHSRFSLTTSGLGRTSIRDYMNDTSRIINQQIGDCVLIGWSMGSLICQQVAADNRHVKKLVLLPSTPPAGMLLPFPVIVRTIMHYGLAMIPPGHKFMISRRDAEEFIFSTGFTSVEKKEFFQELGPESGLALFEIFTQQVPLAVVHRNVCDVLVVGAKEDKTNPISIQKEIARRLGDVPYVEIVGASHALIVQPSVRDRAFEAVASWACPGLSLEAIRTNRVGQFTIF